MIIQITDDFELAKIAESGQCFRFNRVEENCYRIIHMAKCLYIEKLSQNTYRLDCEESEFETVWKDYFDLDEDYSQIRTRIDKQQDLFLYHAAEHEKGIRILRQMPWEALISFIISQNKNIPAIKKSIELLALSAGEKRMDTRGQEYYAFPTPEEIAALGEDDLRACRLGYRSKYISAAAQAVLEGKLDLDGLMLSDEQETIRQLTGLYGVGAKVANCVSLYGLHHIDAFPIDVWVRRVLDHEYPDGYPYSRYSPYNGIYQQYLFAYYRSQYQ